MRAAVSISIIGLAAVLLGVGAAPASAGAAPASRAPSAGHQHVRWLTVGRALKRAAAIGRPVAVTSATTASSTLTANPNGSLTLRQMSEPARKWTGQRWVKLNPALIRSGNSIVTAATTGDLAFSDGGTGPLVTMRLGAKRLSLWLPVRLPVPVVSGATATYRSVLPGVDLRVTADAQGGFSEVLVVRDRAAARDPELRHLVMRASAAGVRLSQGPGGQLLARDSAGVPVFAAQRPVMWDSGRPPAGTKVVRMPRTGQLVDAGSGDPAFSSAQSPGVGARTSLIAMRVAGDRISLTPPASALESRSTVYPVYIDPNFTPPSAGSKQSAWAEVNSDFQTQTYWKPSQLQVGDQAWQSPFFVARSFVKLPMPTVINGAVILSAQLNFTETYAPACASNPNEPTNVDLYEIGTSSNAVSPSTNWNNQPAWPSGNKITMADVAHGYDSSCPSAGVGFTVTSFVSGLAAERTTPSTVWYGLRANDESNAYGWKMFGTGVTLSITYDHTADTPVDTSRTQDLTTTPPTACPASTPTTVGDGPMTLNVHVDDPDRGSNGSPQVGVKILLWDTATGNMVPGFPTSPNSVYANAGSTATMPVSQSALEAVAGGQVTEFAWAVYATDFRQVNGSYVYTTNPSTTCSFYFDPTRQGPPAVTETGSATIGQQASFSVTPPTTGGAPASYQYQLNGGPPDTVTASSGDATITVTPFRAVNTLVVTSLSAGGNYGASEPLTFAAAAGAVAPDGDLTGDGTADLLTVGGTSGLPPGLWLAAGLRTGQVTTPVDIGANGDGFTGDDSPKDFNGDQAFTGLFNCAATSGLQDVFNYDPSTGAGSILFGTGDGSPIPAQQSGWTQSLTQITDVNGVVPQMLVNAGNTTGLSEPFPDLLGISGNALTLYSMS